jgi:hypothetical protein
MGDVDTVVRNAFAVQDADALRTTLTRVLGLPTLTPGARRHAAALLERLRGVTDEPTLDAALETLPALVACVAGWPVVGHEVSPPMRTAEGRSWQDRRILRFAAVVSVLAALEEGPSDRGLRLAATALVLARTAREERPPGPPSPARGIRSWATDAAARRFGGAGRRRPGIHGAPGRRGAAEGW